MSFTKPWEPERAGYCVGCANDSVAAYPRSVVCEHVRGHVVEYSDGSAWREHAAERRAQPASPVDAEERRNDRNQGDTMEHGNGQTTEITPAPRGLGREQIDLIKTTVAKGATDEELRLFLHACERTGLDPLMRQIHAVKRWSKEARREVMSIQTGIDGLRLVAERTGRYAPGREPSYTDGLNGLEVATAYVKKQTADGTWHEVAASAHFAEYAQHTREGALTRFWSQMPHVMLAKCAEAIALRRAFPMELSGIYTHDEMAQADGEEGPPRPVVEQPRAVVVPLPQMDTGPALGAEAAADTSSAGYIPEKDRRGLFAECSKAGKTHADLKDYLGREHGVESTKGITPAMYPAVLAWVRASDDRQPGAEG